MSSGGNRNPLNAELGTTGTGRERRGLISPRSSPTAALRQCNSPLEVYEERPVFRAERVAWVRLAVQQLFGGTALADRSPLASQRVAEKLPVRVSERRSVFAARDELLGLRDSICELRCREIDLLHAGMQALERVRVVGWRDLSRGHRFVVGPHVHDEAVTHVDAWLDSRVKR